MKYPNNGPKRPATSKKVYAELLDGLVTFIHLGEGKRPELGKVIDPKNQSIPAHELKNFDIIGAIPTEESQLVILDIDNRNGLTPEVQVERLLEYYGFPLDTLVVQTPSNGYHIYYLWPNNFALPKNTALANYTPKDVKWNFTGDIRSAGKKGYCVIPGSYSEHGEYRIVSKRKPKRITAETAYLFNSNYRGNAARTKALDPLSSQHKNIQKIEESCEKILKDFDNDYNELLNNKIFDTLSIYEQKKILQQALEENQNLLTNEREMLSLSTKNISQRFYKENISFYENNNISIMEKLESLRVKSTEDFNYGSGYRNEPENKITVEPNEKILEKLKKLLEDRKKKYFERNPSMNRVPWHIQRGVVFNSLVCCYSDKSIASYWKALGIDKDYSRSKSNHYASLSKKEINNELLHLVEREGGQHFGMFCIKRKTYSNESGEPLSKEELISISNERLKVSKGFVKPKVVNMNKVYDEIYKPVRGKKVSEKIQKTAMELMNGPIQGWSNFGSTNIVISKTFMKNLYDCDEQESSNVIRLLLRRGILEVSVKQASGRAPSFRVSDDYINYKLSGKLIEMKTKYNDVYVDWSSKEFVDPFTGEILEPIHVLNTPAYMVTAAAKHFETAIYDSYKFWESLPKEKLRTDNSEKLRNNLEKAADKRNVRLHTNLSNVSNKIGTDVSISEDNDFGVKYLIGSTNNDKILRNVRVFRPIQKGFPTFRPLVLTGVVYELFVPKNTKVVVTDTPSNKALPIKVSELLNDCGINNEKIIIVYSDNTVIVRDDMNETVRNMDEKQSLDNDPRWVSRNKYLNNIRLERESLKFSRKNL